MIRSGITIRGVAFLPSVTGRSPGEQVFGGVFGGWYGTSALLASRASR